jgi:hypothetical protein
VGANTENNMESSIKERAYAVNRLTVQTPLLESRNGLPRVVALPRGRIRNE